MRKLERSPSSPTLLARGRAAWKLARSSLPSMHFAHLAIADEQKKVSLVATKEPGTTMTAAKLLDRRAGGLVWLANTAVLAFPYVEKKSPSIYYVHGLWDFLLPRTNAMLAYILRTSLNQAPTLVSHVLCIYVLATACSSCS